MSTTETKSTEHFEKKHICKCKYGMKCKLYRKCIFLQQRKQELPDYILEHVKKFGHPRKNICPWHYTSRPDSKCRHFHLGDTDIIMQNLLCYYDMECNNPNCKYLHGWNCPYGINCKNPTCPLIHPIIKDPAGNIVDDRRRHIVEYKLFGNYPKSKGKKEDENKDDKKEEESMKKQKKDEKEDTEKEMKKKIKKSPKKEDEDEDEGNEEEIEKEKKKKLSVKKRN